MSLFFTAANAVLKSAIGQRTQNVLQVAPNIASATRPTKARNVFLDTNPTLDDDDFKQSNRNKRLSHGNDDSMWGFHQGSSFKDMYNPAAERQVSTMDIVYNNCKPVYNILRGMGVLPYTRTAQGHTEFKIASPAMGYSFLVYCCLAVS